MKMFTSRSIALDLLFLCLFSNIDRVGSVVLEKDLFPFGPSAGDSELAGESSGPITLRKPFPLYNGAESIVYISRRGYVGFRVLGDPDCGPKQYWWYGFSKIVPFNGNFASEQTQSRLGGSIYYRETNDPMVRSKANVEIRTAFPQFSNINIGQLFIVTWYKLTFAQAAWYCSHTNTSALRNTLQLTLASDGLHSFAFFYYTNITWSTRSTDGVGCSSVCKDYAIAGIDPPAPMPVYRLPTSCTRDIMHIGDTSNVGSPGKWLFRIDTTVEMPDCDSETYMTKNVRISPAFMSVFGQNRISITGPCLNESSQVTCTFDDGGVLVHAPATIVVDDRVSKAICTVPYLFTLGRIDVALNVQRGDQKDAFSGYIYTDHIEEQVRIDIEPLAEGRLRVDSSWDPGLFSSDQTLELVLMEYDDKKIDWIERGVFGKNIANTGFSQVLMPQQDIATFAVFVLRTATQTITSAIKLPRKLAVAAVSATVCGAWYALQPDAPPSDPDILHCPPTERLARSDYRFEQNDILMKILRDAALLVSLKDIKYFIQKTPTNSGAAQMCAYHDDRLYMQPPWAGHVLSSAPDNWQPRNAFGYIMNEAVPQIACCFLAKVGNVSGCPAFYKKRPTDSGELYEPPTPIRAHGDPHMTTFDSVAYTFNGVGEFWMIKNSRAGDFEMQARTEEYTGIDGESTSASIFTAFVMRQIDAKVQVEISANVINVYLDDQLLVLDADAKARTVPTKNVVVTISANRQRVDVSFTSGYSFTFEAVDSSLTLTSVADAKIKGTGSTRGLLGVYDGNAQNDLQTPNGTIILTNASMETIHYAFGLQWMIEEQESLFIYRPGTNYASYKRADFEPSFVRPDAEKMPADIVEMCDGEFACLYDYSTTGSVLMANVTRQSVQVHEEAVETFSTKISMCPALNSPEHGQMNVTNFFVNSTVEFGCDDGYMLRGNTKVTCMESEKWSGDAPTCNSATRISSFIGLVIILIAITHNCFWRL